MAKLSTGVVIMGFQLLYVLVMMLVRRVILVAALLLDAW